MLAGHIDCLTASGFVVGWAFDRNQPARPLHVAVVDRDGEQIGTGLAHCYRADLVTAHCGIGWCAFQVRVSGSVSRLRKSAITLLHHEERSEIHRVDPVPYSDDSEPLLAEIGEIARSDPTVLLAIEQLHGCEEMFAAFVRRRGVEMFVRTAYVYVLGRPADVEGRALYGRLLRNGLMTPLALLRTLQDSDEFRSRPRLLGAPNTPAFPFHSD